MKRKPAQLGRRSGSGTTVRTRADDVKTFGTTLFPIGTLAAAAVFGIHPALAQTTTEVGAQDAKLLAITVQDQRDREERGYQAEKTRIGKTLS